MQLTKEQYKQLNKELSPELRQLIVIANNTKDIEKKLNNKELEIVKDIQKEYEPKQEVKRIVLLEQKKNKKISDRSIEMLKAGFGTEHLFHFYNMNMDRSYAEIMDEAEKYAKEKGLPRTEMRFIVSDIYNSYHRNYLRKEIWEIAEEQDFVRENPTLYKEPCEMSYDEEKYQEEKREEEQEENEFSFFHNPFDLWQQS